MPGSQGSAFPIFSILPKLVASVWPLLPLPVLALGLSVQLQMSILLLASFSSCFCWLFSFFKKKNLFDCAES